MLDLESSLRSSRIVTILFAFLSGLTVVSTAVAPSLLHI
jgi:hypothetical protein